MSELLPNQVEPGPYCFFGVGNLLQDCIESLLSMMGKPPVFLLDNDAEKWGKRYWGIECLSPDTLAEKDKSLTVIITVRHYEMIQAQLKALGFNKLHVIVYERGYNRVRAISPLSLPQKNVALNLDQLLHKTALVTGASRGVGFEIARSLAQLGVNIIAHSRSHHHNAKIVSLCEQHGVSARSVAADLADAKQVDAMADELDEVDILINCAGISLSSSGRWRIQAEDFLQTLKVNTVAPVLLCNRLIPVMLEKGYGRVVNVSSTIQHRPYELAYACSKAALDKYVHDVAPSLQDSNIKISLLDPGWLKTDMGGTAATHEVDTVIPGALLGVVMDSFENGSWFSAQDYVGLTLPEAVNKAHWLMSSMISQEMTYD